MNMVQLHRTVNFHGAPFQSDVMQGIGIHFTEGENQTIKGPAQDATDKDQ